LAVGAGRLLEPQHEVDALGPVGLLRPRRELQNEQVVDPVVDGHVHGRGVSLGHGYCPRDVFLVALGAAVAAVANIRAVDGKAGDDLTEGLGEADQREVAGGAVLLGDAVEPMSERVQLGRHGRLHDEPLGPIDDLGEGGALA